MAPTICSDKKTQIRSGIKDIRKQSTTSGLSTSPSSAINYAQKRSKLMRPYPVRAKQSPDTFRHHPIGSSDGNSSDDLNERMFSPQSPLSSMSDNSISTLSESSLLSPLSLSSFPSPLTGSMSAEACSPCEERLNPFHHNSDSSASRAVYPNPHSNRSINNQDNIENDDDAISRSSSVLTSDSRSDITSSSMDDDKSNGRPLALLQLQHNEKNTKGLFEIAIKTIKLVRRNQLLQRRLAQLQLETSEFIQSVLANPENRALRDKMHVSSGCEKI